MSRLSLSELLDRLRAGDESVEIEAKRAEEIGKSVIETVSSLSNEPGLGGGYLLLGVERSLTPDGPGYEVVGVSNPDKAQADLATQCRTVFNIPVRPQITIDRHEGKNVIVVFIPEVRVHEKPVFLVRRGLPAGAFRRIGSTDQHCTEEDIELLYQLRSYQGFDETAVTDSALDDFDAQALAEYRRVRARANPNAAELAYTDEELLHALGAAVKHRGDVRATIAGLVLFGTPAALRRHFPMTRVDYIRVPGREWVPDPDERYQSVEMRAPLMTLIPRMVSQVMDDIPKAFSLAEDQLYRRDVPLIPNAVVREAIVNAVMHRSYRRPMPVQIIRYANRIEIRNPGHSLVPDDQLGEPGSVPRNVRIASVLHEAGLAETKGTGIRAMREAMERANLTLPLFESDREADIFTVRLLLHHLLGPEDIEWLGHFRDCNLAEDEARALIFVREVGAINNLAYRQINHLDTLTASGRLRRLRDLGLLEQRGKGSATYYVPTEWLLAPLASQARSQPVEASPATDHLPVELSGLPVELSGLPVELSGLSGKPAPLPEGLVDRLRRVLGQRTDPRVVRGVIFELCRWRPMRLAELAGILDRHPRYVLDTYLRPMIREGRLRYTHPGSPTHPEQAYRASINPRAANHE